MHALCQVGSMPVIVWVEPLDHKHSHYYGKYRKTACLDHSQDSVVKAWYYVFVGTT